MNTWAHKFGKQGKKKDAQIKIVCTVGSSNSEMNVPRESCIIHKHILIAMVAEIPSALVQTMTDH